MKMEDKVAGRFMKARGIEADYGDVTVYFNAFDYLEPKDGGRMTPDQARDAMSFMETATSKSFKMMDQAVNTALRKMRLKIDEAGLRQKR